MQSDGFVLLLCPPGECDHPTSPAFSQFTPGPFRQPQPLRPGAAPLPEKSSSKEWCTVCLRGCGAAARVTQNFCDQNNCITKRRWARSSRGRRRGVDRPQFLKTMERRCKPATEYFVSSPRSSHCLRRTQQMRKCPLHSGRQAGAPLLGSSCAPLGM